MFITTSIIIMIIIEVLELFNAFEEIVSNPSRLTIKKKLEYWLSNIKSNRRVCYEVGLGT